MNNIIGFCRKSWERTFVRFLCVGSFNTILDLTILNILIELARLPILFANTVSVTAGFTVSYFLNHKVVFRYPKKYSFKSYIHFFLVTGLGVILIQNVVIYTATHTGIARSGHTYHLLELNVSNRTVVLNVAKILAILVGMIWNFLLYKYVIFRQRDKLDSADEIIVA